jgi:hypothetical protein
MINALGKKLIEDLLDLPFNKISDYGSEELNDHIEQKVIKSKLTISESNCDIVLKRGYVLSLTSSEEINSQIDSILRGHTSRR